MMMMKTLHMRTFITSSRCSAITANFSIKFLSRSSVACEIIAERKKKHYLY